MEISRIGRAKGSIAWLLPFMAGLLIGALFHGFILPVPYPPSSIPRSVQPSFQLMAEAWNAIDSHFVDRASVRPRTMTYGAIAGMVASLGDTGHSAFLSPDMVQAQRIIETGQFAGIGAELLLKNGRFVIVAPLDGSPAQNAGIHAGDIIVAVDNSGVSGLSLQEVVQKIMGPAGTRITLTLEDAVTGLVRKRTLERSNIKLQSVTWNMLPGLRLAHLRIAFFSQGTSQALEKALAEIKMEGAKGLVLDLRNNPGGLLDAAVGVASQFLRNGAVLQEKNAKGQVQTIAVNSDVNRYDEPMVVLINSGTASASEIVAGALQDAKRATLIGETTFGTGTVLQTVPLSDGSALLLAVREWFTPHGRTIWHKGITPDVAAPMPPDGMRLMPEAERGMTRAQLNSSKDLQLLRSLKLLGRNDA